MAKTAVSHNKIVLRILLIILTLNWFVGTSRVHSQVNCSPPFSNPIVCENSLLGNPPSEWDITGSGDPSIQGYAADLSVNRGQTVNFKINTTAGAYRIDIYRLGYYGGLGARKVATIQPTASLPQTQPTGFRDLSTGLYDCGNWAVSASWSVPTNATSGIYIARPVRSDTGGASHIIFIVRDDAGRSDLLFQTSDTTWQTYNSYGGASLYRGNGPGTAGRAYKVSYNRPFNDRGQNVNSEQHTWFFGSEYPMVRWIEANGYNVSYISGIDTDRRGSAALTQHKVFLSVGHDEYWSGGQRTNVETARAAGVNLAFFSGNEIFVKTRWENSIDGTGTPYRTLVCYKESFEGVKLDPSPLWTGTWRDPRFSPPSDGGYPENALSGQMFTVNAYRSDPITISSGEGKLRFWRNTGLELLTPGQTAQLPSGILGFEWDEALDNGFSPAGLLRLSTTTIQVDGYRLLDYGSAFDGIGKATHNLTLYRHSSGALVFGAGTIHWSWGLDATHDFPGVPTDVRMQQATANLFADMNVLPITLQPGLAPVTPSSDTLSPTSVILPFSPTLPACTPFTISGTATDAGGGKPAAVEVSFDGGATWRHALGAASWSATWTAPLPGVMTIRSRAIDDSGLMETPGPGVTLTVVSNSSSCMLWPAQTTPAAIDIGDAEAVELGVRFRSDVDGWITGLRFYKSVGNTGLHVGTLWTTNGTALATTTFIGETPSGWQQAALAVPVHITAGTTYVASYHTDTGHFSDDQFYFAGIDRTALDRPPLHVVTNGFNTPNGVYIYGPRAFPTDSYRASNYYIDVLYAFGLGLDTLPPMVTSVSPLNGAADAPASTAIAVTFNEPVALLTILPSTFTLKDAQNNNISASVTYDAATRTARLQPSTALNPSMTYTATVKGQLGGITDLLGNLLTSNVSWSFTTSVLAGCPCTIWQPGVTPAIPDVGDPNAVELGVRFQSDVNGWITGLRFYKSAANLGVHTGSLWTTNGTLLATVTFIGETLSGWQQATLPTAVPILAGTPYIASYHADLGHFSFDEWYFTNAVDRPPLHALVDSVTAANGIAVYGPSVFPTNTYHSGNYWVDVVFAMPTQVAPPVFTPAAGTYGTSGFITLSDTTSGAQIYYTTNGTVPTTSSTRYTAPIAITTTTTIKAIGVAAGWVDSTIAVATYILQVAAPAFSPAGGNYSTTQSVSLSDVTPGAQIYYTTNGSTPTTSSTRYLSPIPVTNITSIKAIGVVTGWSNSSISSATYTFQTATPTFSPTGGVYLTAQLVTLSDTSPGAQIYYTTNGSTPTISSTLYTAPIAVSTTMTINAIGVINGWSNSIVATANYTIQTVPPAAPSALAAIAVSTNQINLSWSDNATNETGFKIERKIGAGGTYAQIATVGSGVIAYNDTNLVASTTYFYRVRATNPAGDSPYSNEANSTTSSGPTGLQGDYFDNSDLTALKVSRLDSTVNFAWGSGSPDPTIGADTFSVRWTGQVEPAYSQTYTFYTTSDDGIRLWINGQLVINNWTDHAPIENSGTIILVANQRYDVLLEFYENGGGAVAQLSWSSASQPKQIIPSNRLFPTIPFPPTSMTATAVSVSQINLAWTDAANNEAGFAIERSTDGTNFVEITTVGPNITTFTNLGLLSNTTYIYRVRAYSNIGTSPYSNLASATTPGLPASPSGLNASAVSSTQINLTWVDNALNETGFKIERKTGAGGTYAQIATVGANVTTYSDTGLAAATVYFYRVRSTNSIGDSAYSTEVSAATFATVPAAPSNLTPTSVSTTQINLTWVDNASNETGFKIERKTGAGGTYAQIATVGAGVTTYTNTGLAAATTYFYRVRATNAVGDSAYSPEASATTFDTIPAAPTGLTANPVSSSQINLTWVDNASNETGFKIERKTGAGGAYAQIATVGMGITAYTNTGLAAAITYFYRVRATNAVGDSAYSPEASATTFTALPAAPSSLTPVPTSSTQINLTWVDNASNETGFKIERKTGAGGTYAQIATVSIGVTAYANSGLIAGTTYFYRVRATNAAGDSAYSPEASATTLIPAFRSATSVGATSGTLSLTINKPSGTQQGDVMVASIAIRPSTAVITATGWTLVRRVDNANANANSLVVYYKVAGASEPANYQWTFNTSTGSAGGIRSFSGIDTDNPIDVEAGQNSASGLTVTAPSVTTRFASDMIVTSHAISSTATFAAPVGMTEAFDVSSDAVPAAAGESIQGNYLLQAAIAATGTLTATASNDADVGNAHTLALKAR